MREGLRRCLVSELGECFLYWGLCGVKRREEVARSWLSVRV